MALTDIDMKKLGTSIQMVGAVYADTQRAWMVLLPGVDVEDPKPVHLTLDEWTQFLRQTDLVEVECLVRDPVTKQIGKAILRKSERQVSQGVSWQVFRRDGFKCRYCGVDDMPLTVDHLITWESGGPSIPENLVACCRECNAARGETPYGEWLQTAFYRRVSKNIHWEEQFQNTRLVATLASIPVSPKVGKRSR